jgi:hypothetical protein
MSSTTEAALDHPAPPAPAPAPTPAISPTSIGPMKPSPCYTSSTSRTSMSTPENSSRNEEGVDSSTRTRTSSPSSRGEQQRQQRILFHSELRRAASLRYFQGVSTQVATPVARALHRAAASFVSPTDSWSSHNDISFYDAAIDLATGVKKNPTTKTTTTTTTEESPTYDNKEELSLPELVGALATRSRSIIVRQQEEIKCLRLTVQQLILELLGRNNNRVTQDPDPVVLYQEKGLPQMIEIQESSSSSDECSRSSSKKGEGHSSSSLEHIREVSTPCFQVAANSSSVGDNLASTCVQPRTEVDEPSPSLCQKIIITISEPERAEPSQQAQEQQARGQDVTTVAVERSRDEARRFVWSRKRSVWLKEVAVSLDARMQATEEEDDDDKLPELRGTEPAVKEEDDEGNARLEEPTNNTTTGSLESQQESSSANVEEPDTLRAIPSTSTSIEPNVAQPTTSLEPKKVVERNEREATVYSSMPARDTKANEKLIIIEPTQGARIVWAIVDDMFNHAVEHDVEEKGAQNGETGDYLGQGISGVVEKSSKAQDSEKRDSFEIETQESNSVINDESDTPASDEHTEIIEQATQSLDEDATAERVMPCHEVAASVEETLDDEHSTETEATTNAFRDRPTTQAVSSDDNNDQSKEGGQDSGYRPPMPVSGEHVQAQHALPSTNGSEQPILNNCKRIHEAAYDDIWAIFDDMIKHAVVDDMIKHAVEHDVEEEGAQNGEAGDYSDQGISGVVEKSSTAQDSEKRDSLEIETQESNSVINDESDTPASDEHTEMTDQATQSLDEDATAERVMPCHEVAASVEETLDDEHSTETEVTTNAFRDRPTTQAMASDDNNDQSKEGDQDSGYRPPMPVSGEHVQAQHALPSTNSSEQPILDKRERRHEPACDDAQHMSPDSAARHNTNSSPQKSVSFKGDAVDAQEAKESRDEDKTAGLNDIRNLDKSTVLSSIVAGEKDYESKFNPYATDILGYGIEHPDEKKEDTVYRRTKSESPRPASDMDSKPPMQEDQSSSTPTYLASKNVLESNQVNQVETVPSSYLQNFRASRNSGDTGDARPDRPHRPPTRRHPEDFVFPQKKFVFPSELTRPTMFLRENEFMLVDPPPTQTTLDGSFPRKLPATEQDKTATARRNSVRSAEILASIGVDDSCSATLEQYLDFMDK